MDADVPLQMYRRMCAGFILQDGMYAVEVDATIQQIILLIRLWWSITDTQAVQWTLGSESLAPNTNWWSKRTRQQTDPQYVSKA